MWRDGWNAFFDFHHVLNARYRDDAGNCIKGLNTPAVIGGSAGKDNEGAVGFDLRPVLTGCDQRGFGVTLGRIFQRRDSKTGNQCCCGGAYQKTGGG